MERVPPEPDVDNASETLAEVIKFLYDISIEDLPPQSQARPVAGGVVLETVAEAEVAQCLAQMDDEIERICAVRQDNLMRLWAVQSIVHAKPELLVEGGAGGGEQQPHPAVCKFCRKNGEPRVVYEGHLLKDAGGLVSCPILQRHACELCGATGRHAHTLRYCPLNAHKDADDDLPPYRLLANGAMTSSHNHK